MPPTVLMIGDCIDRMRELVDESVDAVVTDPPYGIGFMGHEWDQPAAEHGAVSAGHGGCNVSFGGAPHPAMEAGRYDLSSTANRRFQAWCEAWGRECLRVLKPGGHAVVFGSPRTYHRLAVGLEDAGFEIRDGLMWLFGSGFPKSMNVGKSIDSPFYGPRCEDGWITPEAREHGGLGTALKPGYEPIVLARKPLDGTVAATVLEHGTGALDIDSCRIATDEDPSCRRRAYGVSSGGAIMSDRTSAATYAEDRPGERAGRWPANVLLDDRAAGLLDEQSGARTSGARTSGAYRSGGDGTIYGAYGETEQPAIEASTGGASRFYYTSKASTAEREAGLAGLATSADPLTTTSTSTLQHGRSGGQQVDDRVPERSPRANVHPTVKPIDVMRWLVRLVTPPGGLVLDPFLGSGTTGCAATLEGYEFVGIERDDDYAAIAEERIAWWSRWPTGTPTLSAIRATARPASEVDHDTLKLALDFETQETQA